MVRSILSVLAGVVAWTALWIPFGQVMMSAFPDIIDPRRYLGHVPILLTYIAASFVFSIAAGYITALIAKSKPRQHALALGIVQLAIGIGFEMSYWNLLPVWYHLVFLALLIPGNVLGGKLREGKDARRPVRV
jgi:hypothetical protein